MSKLTLDEAIKHCLEAAEQQEADSFIDRWSDDDEWSESLKENCRQCAADHRQLAEWLKELKLLRRKAEHLTEWNCKLKDYKNEIICKWGESQEELQEAKRLLKSAIDEWPIVCEWGNCGEYCGWYVNGQCSQKWSKEAEALKLIGEEDE